MTAGPGHGDLHIVELAPGVFVVVPVTAGPSTSSNPTPRPPKSRRGPRTA